MSKFEIAISTLLLGFFLGQTVDFVKYRYGIRRKRSALESEVDDVLSEFQEKLTRIKQIIETLSKSHVAVPTPGKINAVIYDSIYADIAAFYERKERKAINHIYTHIQHYNQELTNGDRSSFELAKKSLFHLYHHSKYGYETALYFRRSGGKDLIMEDGAKIDEINQEIHEVALQCGFTS